MIRNSLVLILTVLSLSACTAQDGNPMPKSADNQIYAKKPVLADSETFETKLRTAGVQLIDVRTPGEYATGHISNAILVDISDYESFKASIAELDKSKPVLVYCAAGGRSAQAAAYLSDQGFGEVYDLKGGINTWKSSGMNVTMDK